MEESWRYHKKEVNNDDLFQKMRDFDRLLQDIKNNGIKKPIIYTKNFNDNKIIVHGNHRSSIAFYLGFKVPAIEIPQREYFQRNIKLSNAFYGTGKNGLPYNSIFYKGRPLLYGRRNDIYERLNLMDEKDIYDKEIIDFGCNFGASTFAAIEKGAKKALGLEYEPEIVTSAIRFNIIFQYACDFKVCDLSQEVNIDRMYDTGFCFSIDKHVKNNSNLTKNIVNHVKNTLYFETHSNSDVPYDLKKNFKKIKFLGNTGPLKDRRLYKLYIVK